MSKNKLHVFIAVIGCLIILSVATVIILQIEKNHKANELIIEKCFEKFDEYGKVVVMKDSFWSPVTCEKK